VLIGLVSDSHGLSEPALPRLLAGSDLILHAGDVMKPSVLADLQAVAPVQAVRGNNDVLGELAALPESRLIQLGALSALLVHDLGPPAAPHPAWRRLLARHRPQLVIHGHSHRPGAVLLDGLLYVNPGSAGPRRFSLPRSAGRLTVRGRAVRVELFDLASRPPELLVAPLEVELSHIAG
jgi:hypothetical protein